jgi:AcrR family transcriptional regulator
MAATSLRDTVLAAAVDYIADNGPDGLSFRQVAIAAGVSHQAPYHHGIFQAIATEGYELFTTAMLESLAAEPEDPTTALLEAYVNFALEHRGHFRVMFRPDLCAIADSPKLQRIADGSFDVLVDHVRDLLGPKAPLKDIRARAAAILLIDGPLEAKIGPVSSRRALIRAVAEQSGLANPPKRR